MLRSMREGAKSPIMKAFLLFLAGGFALWGIGDITSGSFGAGSKAVSAGDKSISTTEAAIEFDRARRNLAPGLSIGEALQTPIMDEVMGALARKVLFSAEADRLGLTVTREMQTKAIRDERAFQDEFGSFAEGRFLQTLQQLGYSEEDYLTRLTETLERDQIMGAVSAAALYPFYAAQTLAAYQLEERAIAFQSFAVDASAVAAPSDAELSSYYNENQSSYDAPLLRQFDAIILDPEQLEAEITISDAALQDSFELRRDEFITPETRRLSQMVFDSQQAADDALSDLSSGKEFAVVAADRLGWTSDDIALGTLRQDAIAADLADAAFAADEGDVVGPIETAFGFHILAVDEIIAGGDASFEDVKGALAATLRAEQALDLVYERANALEDELGSGASLAEAASAVGATVTSLSPIDANGLTIDGTASDNDIASDSNFLAIAWDLQDDEISVLGETGEATFFVMQLLSETEPASRPLAEVKDRVIADYQLETAIKAAKAEADAALALGQIGNNAETATIQRSGIGLDHPAANLMAANAFDINANEFVIVETGEEALLIQVSEVIAAPAEQTEALARQLTSSLARTIQSDWQAALALSLSEDFDLTMNQEAVRTLLVGAAQ